jgi:hypothetical protein
LSRIWLKDRISAVVGPAAREYAENHDHPALIVKAETSAPVADAQALLDRV